MGETTPLFPPPFNPEQLPENRKLSDPDKAADWILSHDMNELGAVTQPGKNTDRNMANKTRNLGLKHEAIDDMPESYFDRHEVLDRSLSSDTKPKKQKNMVSLAEALKKSPAIQQVKSKMVPDYPTKIQKSIDEPLLKRTQYKKFVEIGFICGVVIAIVIGVMAYF